MKYRPLLLIFPLLASTVEINGQDTDYDTGYQTMMINNPAFAGSGGDGTLRLSYFNFYPGNNYDFHSFFLSYDSYFPVLHGGAGIYLAKDYLGGIVNDLKGGLSYSYFLRAGKNFYINAGLSAGFYSRGFDFSNAIFPDEIDPMGVINGITSEALSGYNRTVFDISTGFLFIWERVFGGFSIAHLSEPDLASGGFSGEKLKRRYLLHVIGEFDLNTKYEMKARPLANLGFQGNSISVGAGALFEVKHLSVNLMVLADNIRNIDMQTGFSINTGRILIFYNYRFNIRPGNSSMPFSLIHQPGLAFSLNNVEKRSRSETINIPGM